MLHHLSWAVYLKAVAALLIIYYGYVYLKYFRNKAEKLRHAKPAPGIAKPDYQVADTGAGGTAYMEPVESSGYEDAGRMIGEADAFIAVIKKIIHQAAANPFAPEALQLNLQNIFKDNAALRKSPHRPAINELVVSECERTGTALFTEEEVDRWWGDQ